MDPRELKAALYRVKDFIDAWDDQLKTSNDLKDQFGLGFNSNVSLVARALRLLKIDLKPRTLSGIAKRVRTLEAENAQLRAQLEQKETK